jgi:hypothetical protein
LIPVNALFSTGFIYSSLERYREDDEAPGGPGTERP